jgi:hypothetical protein
VTCPWTGPAYAGVRQPTSALDTPDWAAPLAVRPDAPPARPLGMGGDGGGRRAAVDGVCGGTVMGRAPRASYSGVKPAVGLNHEL